MLEKLRKINSESKYPANSLELQSFFGKTISRGPTYKSKSEPRGENSNRIWSSRNPEQSCYLSSTTKGNFWAIYFVSENDVEKRPIMDFQILVL